VARGVHVMFAAHIRHGLATHALAQQAVVGHRGVQEVAATAAGHQAVGATGAQQQAVGEHQEEASAWGDQLHMGRAQRRIHGNHDGQRHESPLRHARGGTLGGGPADKP